MTEIVISYKMIYENIYNIMVVSKIDGKYEILFKYQGY